MISELTRVFPGSRDWQWIGSGGYATTYRGVSAQGQPMVGRVLSFESISECAHRSITAQRLKQIQVLKHPRLWPIQSVVEDEHIYWLSPWFDVSSGAAQEPLAKRVWPVIFSDLCGALAAIHGSGLLHLNVHPGNVVAQSARFSLCDIHPLPEGVVRSRRVLHQQELVGAHPAYAAPEQIMGESTGPATDIYSLACVFVEALIGRPCWTGANFADVCVRKTREAATLDPSLPMPVSRALERALALDPFARPASAEEFLQELGTTATLSRTSNSRTRVDGAGDVIMQLFAPVDVLRGESVLIHFGADAGDGALALARGSDPRAEVRCQFSVAARDGIDVDVRVDAGQVQRFRLNALRLRSCKELQHLVLSAPTRTGNAVVEVTVKQGQRVLTESKFVWFVRIDSTTGVPTVSAPQTPQSNAPTPTPTLIFDPPKPDAVADPPTLPGYEIVRALGQGGMASVYLAVQNSLGRQVAIKLCRSAVLHDDGNFQRRFVQEARLLARLGHTNVCAIYDIVAQDNQAYYAMEYLPGGTLSDRVREGLTVDAALELLVTIAGGLQYVHDQGIVHRDLKPQNIMYRENGTPVLLDFGISKQVEDRVNTGLTQAGMLVGTPTYMSPEQINSGDLDGRSDVYALGVIAYELFTGAPPFGDDSPIAVLMGHLTTPAPRIETVSTSIADVVGRMLCKSRDDRYASMREVEAALRACSRRLTAPLPRPDVTQSLPVASVAGRLRESKLSSTLFGRLAAFVRKSEGE